MKDGSRSWMYNRNNPGRRGMRNEFAVGVAEFIAKAKTLDDFIRNGEIRCPCEKCKCIKVKNLVDVEMHLYRKGFMPNYFVWVHHGESRDMGDDVNFQNVYGGGSGPVLDNDLDNYRMNDMVNDAFGMYSEEPSQPGTSQPRITSQASECGSNTPAPMTLEEETALWLEVNDGVKKGSTYGIGSQYASDRLNPGLFGTYTPASSINPSVEAKLLNEIEELKRKSEEDRLRNEASMNAMREMMQNWMSSNSDKGKKKDKSKRKRKSKSRGKGKTKRRYNSSSESSFEATE